MSARARFLPAWVACAALLVAAGARAQDDQGTQSVFGVAAGNRGLAMGSAFIVLADDGSALLWNPAGLGRVRRAEFQAAQSGDLGQGFHEQYASVVVPSWRWGALSMLFRHFGADGIERRDAANVLLDSNLQDSEIEAALGYGRPLGSAWNVGGSLKLQRQSLAGLSASGLGIDLGASVQPARALGMGTPWMQEVSVALALRNLVQPALRLDRETVSDPTAVRTGLAYALPWGGQNNLLAELDLEKVTHVSARVRFGVECRIGTALALRAGVNDGTLSAGTGLRWRDVTIDYAVQENPLATEHRVGLSYLFGASVDDSREAARQKEDELLERKLADAFRKRQDQQVAALLARAREDRAQGRVDRALEALAAVATLAPDNAERAALEAGCLNDRAAALERKSDWTGAAVSYDLALAALPGDSVAAAGARRCRDQSDRRSARSAEIRQLFSRAMDAFAAGDLASARAGFSAVIHQDPWDPDASAMLQRTWESIARRIESLIDQSRRFMRAGRWAEAERVLDEARQLDPTSADVRGAVVALRAARDAASAGVQGGARASDNSKGRASPLPPAGRVSTMSERELDELYRRGLTAMKEQRSEDAIRYWEIVWSARPDYRQVAAYLKRERLSRGLDLFAAGDLEGAAAEWEKVLEIDPSDERARGYLDRAQKEIARSREILGIDR